jgi:hypothetical protein
MSNSPSPRTAAWISTEHEEHVMKLEIVCALCVAVIGVPCIYDVKSLEPSPLSGGIAATFGTLPAVFEPGKTQ